MSRALSPRRAMPTLATLWSGKCCPHEGDCACRTGGWCPEARERPPAGEQEYPMMYLAGCSFAYDHCCCRVLDEIEDLASGYLQQAGVSEPPVPMELVNLFDPHRRIEIRPLPLRRFLGCTWLVDEEWVVHLNSNASPETNHFTAFHEGFHIICGNSGLALSRAGRRYKPVSERLADYFAASILMPKDTVRGIWSDIRDVGEMADIFRVPEQAMRDWLTRLRLVEA